MYSQANRMGKSSFNIVRRWNGKWSPFYGGYDNSATMLSHAKLTSRVNLYVKSPQWMQMRNVRIRALDLIRITCRTPATGLEDIQMKLLLEQIYMTPSS